MEATTTAAEQVALSAETLRGDVRDILLVQVRQMETPWSKLSERDQQWRIEAIDRAAEKVVREAVRIVANQGFPHLDVRVSSKGKFGDGGIEMTVNAAFSAANLTKISEYGTGSAILVLAEPGEFFGQRGAALAEPDQRAMDLEAARREAEADAAAGEEQDDSAEGSEQPQAVEAEPEAAAAPAKRTRANRSKILVGEPA